METSAAAEDLGLLRHGKARNCWMPQQDVPRGRRLEEIDRVMGRAETTHCRLRPVDQ
jgi:hypothetical protein